jgi:hypothetical protein
VIARRVRVEAADHGETVPLGRMRKRHARDCGRALCSLCHPSKRWHSRADRARARDEWLRDWIA